jgi:hypothetical protein
VKKSIVVEEDLQIETLEEYSTNLKQYQQPSFHESLDQDKNT